MVSLQIVSQVSWQFSRIQEHEAGATSGLATSGSTGSRFKGLPFRPPPKLEGLDLNAHRDAARKKLLKETASCEGSHWAVLATIQAPTDAVEDLAARRGWCLIIVGDKKGPFTYDVKAKVSRVVFVSASAQEHLASDIPFVFDLKWNHFGRKNLGYLLAIAGGAEAIWDFDDDNVVVGEPTLGFPPPLKSGLPNVLWAPKAGARAGNVSAMNIYSAMGCSSWPCWPRGFPPTLIRSGAPALSEWITAKKESTGFDDRRIAVLQSLADNEPDVDAAFRLFSAKAVGIHFKGTSHVLALPSMVFCPANAQAALHRKDAFWALLLPMTVTGRVSDIWRSYLGQRLLWDVGLYMAFSDPIVRQDRNSHDYLADFDAEQQLYSQTEALLSFLWQWRGKESSLPARMEELWTEAYTRGYVELEDIHSLRLWLRSLADVGYAFPPITRTTYDVLRRV